MEHIPRALIRTFYCVEFFHSIPLRNLKNTNYLIFDYLYEYKIILMFRFSLYILSSRARL